VEIEYRKANFNDIKALTELRLKMLNENNNYNRKFVEKLEKYTEEYFINEFTNGNHIAWIALFENKIIAMGGITFFKIHPNDWCLTGKTAYIGNMFTEKEYRKREMANKILSKILEEAKDKNCERILLNTTEDGKNGFEMSPTAMAYYPLGIEYEKKEKE
jgi:N-acetylglutamate synthase-like GNAT family acetyltransferase